MKISCGFTGPHLIIIILVNIAVNKAPQIIAATLLFQDSMGWLGGNVRGSISIAFSLAVSHVLVVKMISGFRAQYLRHQCFFFFPLSMWCLIS